jgi:hypothetical protein
MLQKKNKVLSLILLIFLIIPVNAKFLTQGRIILSLKGEKVCANMGNDVVLDERLLGICSHKQSNHGYAIPITKLAKKYHPSSYKEVQIFSANSLTNSPFVAKKTGASGEFFIILSRDDIKIKKPTLHWDSQKKMLDLKLIHLGQKIHVGSIYKIFFTQESDDKRNNDIVDQDF